MDAETRGRLLALEMLVLPMLSSERYANPAGAAEWLETFPDAFALYAADDDGPEVEVAARQALSDMFARIVMLRSAADRYLGRDGA